MTDADALAREIGGEELVQFFDFIESEQRKRWNVPGWRAQPVFESDRTNWRDIAAAIRSRTADLEAERDRLRDALRPLAEIGRQYGYSYGPDTMVRVRLHLLRALSSPTPEGGKP